MVAKLHDTCASKWSHTSHLEGSRSFRDMKDIDDSGNEVGDAGVYLFCYNFVELLILKSLMPNPQNFRRTPTNPTAFY